VTQGVPGVQQAAGAPEAWSHRVPWHVVMLPGLWAACASDQPVVPCPHFMPQPRLLLFSLSATLHWQGGRAGGVRVAVAVVL
jgi:hypothetical protein